MRRGRGLGLLIGVLLLMAGTAEAQTPAMYTDRARLMADATFVGRVQVAVMVGAIAVALEPAETEDHAQRLKMASFVFREPEFVARRLASLLAATVPAEVDDEGAVSTPLTDAQIQAILTQRWTVFATALTASAG